MQRKALAAKKTVKPNSPDVMDFELEAWLMRDSLLGTRIQTTTAPAKAI
jgi:hypothetical protein